jgi:hypothetical protein
MSKVALSEEASEIEAREYNFTVVFEPLTPIATVRKDGKKVRRARNPSYPGSRLRFLSFLG